MIDKYCKPRNICIFYFQKVRKISLTLQEQIHVTLAPDKQHLANLLAQATTT